MATGLAEPVEWPRCAPSAPLAIIISVVARKRAWASGLVGAANPQGQTVAKDVRLVAVHWVAEHVVEAVVEPDVAQTAPRVGVALAVGVARAVVVERAGVGVAAGLFRPSGCPKRKEPKGLY